MKLESMKPSMIEEFLKLNKFPQAKELVEDIVKAHVEEEIADEDPCDFLSAPNLSTNHGSIPKKNPKDTELQKHMMLFL